MPAKSETDVKQDIYFKMFAITDKILIRAVESR